MAGAGSAGNVKEENQMKGRSAIGFWLGFGLAAVVAIWLVKVWREQQQGMSGHMWGPTERQAPTGGEIAKATPAAHAAGPDQLERIHGIGPATARRLNEAGVRTFAQLARMTVAEVEAIAGNTPWDPADWIRQASELSG
jgi:large subunit ribosomal protein L21